MSAFQLGDEVKITLRGRISGIGGDPKGKQQMITVWVADPDGVMVRDLHGWPSGQHIHVQPEDLEQA